MRKVFYHFILIFLIFLSTCYGQNQTLTETNPPALTEYVTDETGTLTGEQTDSLRNDLRNFYDTTTTQIVVYMIKSLKGESLERVSYEIAQKNGIGTKNNNGVLLFIAKDDRKLRIEVGYGLEGVLTDARAGRIISERITPYFKKGEYYKGIQNGINEIVFVVQYEQFMTSFYEQAEEDDNSTVNSGIGLAVIIITIYFVILGVLIFFAVKKGGASGGYRSSSWSSSGSSSSSSSYRSISTGSSSGGRGFTGGGGSFGGGGASGSW